jgi:hypothetical protein
MPSLWRQDLNPQPTASAMSELEHRIVASAINKKADPSVSNSVPRAPLS